MSTNFRCSNIQALCFSIPAGEFEMDLALHLASVCVLAGEWIDEVYKARALEFASVTTCAFGPVWPDEVFASHVCDRA